MLIRHVLLYYQSVSMSNNGLLISAQPLNECYIPGAGKEEQDCWSI